MVELTEYGTYIKQLLDRQSELIASVGTEEEKKAVKPPVTFLGTKPLPVEVTRDEPGPEGSRIIELRRCHQTSIRNETTGEESTLPVCHETAHIIPRNTIECISELPDRLIERLPEPKPPRLPTARETVRAGLACNEESANAKVLSLLTGLDERKVQQHLGELREECVARGEPETCIVRSPPGKEVSVKIRLGPESNPEAIVLPQKALDPLGLTLYEMNPSERDRIKNDFCPSPCMRFQWWKT